MWREKFSKPNSVSFKSYIKSLVSFQSRFPEFNFYYQMLRNKFILVLKQGTSRNRFKFLDIFLLYSGNLVQPPLANAETSNNFESGIIVSKVLAFSLATIFKSFVLVNCKKGFLNFILATYSIYCFRNQHKNSIWFHLNSSSRFL